MTLAGEPLEVRIFERLAAILAAISVAGGYYFDVGDAAVTLDGAASVAPTAAGSPVIVIEPGTSENWQYENANQATVEIPARVIWVGSPRGPEDPAPSVTLSKGARMRTYWRACRDVLKAVNDDYTLGGLVVDVRVTGRQWDQSLEGQDVYAVIDVSIRTSRDFTTAGGY